MSLTDDFKAALGSWASGVSVVTTNHDGLLYGLTVSSFSSLSLDPPLVLVCLNNGNRLPEMIDASGGFAVSILNRDQEDASNYFARPNREPTRGFTEIDGEWTESKVPVVKGALASIVCEHRNSIEQGTHTIVVGEVVEARANEGAPLLYWRRGYRGVEGGDS
ncbi:MAG: flavin reductase [Proteobacteria bacterium]|nr:flavin reductase [Pseudomonadota bacterium]